MKRLLTMVAAVLLPLAIQAQTHVFYDLASFNASPATNRTITVQRLQPVPGNLESYSSSTNGYFYSSNMLVGDYDVVIQRRGAAGQIAFQITVTDTNLGVIEALENTSVRGVQTYPQSGRSAWTIAASESRYGGGAIPDGSLTTNKINSTFYEWVEGQGTGSFGNDTGLPGVVNGSNIGTNLATLATDAELTAALSASTNGFAQSEVVNVRDYGAVPWLATNVTQFSYPTNRYSMPDNASAIQAAFNAAYASNGRSNTVYFPQGVWQSGSNIYVPPGINVRGVGVLHAGDFGSSPNRLDTNAFSILWFTNSSYSSLVFSNLNTKGSQLSFLEVNGYTNPLAYAKYDTVNSMATNTSANLANGPGIFLGSPSVTDWATTAAAGEGYSGDFQSYNASVVGYKVGVRSTANSVNHFRLHMIACDIAYTTSPLCCGADQTVFNNCSAAERSEGIGYDFYNNGAARGIVFISPSDYQIGTWIRGTNILITVQGGNMEMTAPTTRTNFMEIWGSSSVVNMTGTRIDFYGATLIDFKEPDTYSIGGGLHGCRIQNIDSFDSSTIGAGIPSSYPVLLRTSIYDNNSFRVTGGGSEGWHVTVGDYPTRTPYDAFPLTAGQPVFAPGEAQPHAFGAFAWDNNNILSMYGVPFILKNGNNPDTVEGWFSESLTGPLVHKRQIWGDASTSTAAAAPNRITLDALTISTGGVITNGAVIIVVTNATPTYAAPNGSLAIVSDGRLYMRTNGAWSIFAGGGGGDALVANPLSQFAATTSAQLGGVLSDESGSGVFPLFSLTSLTAGDGVKWSGTGWTNGPIAAGGGSGDLLAANNLTDLASTNAARTNIGAHNASNLTEGILPDARMPNLTGDVTTSEGAVATTIAANAVALGTDTTGNYVATIADSGASEVTVSGSGSETAAVTLALASGITRDTEIDTIAEVEAIWGRKVATNNATLPATSLLVGDGARGVAPTTTGSGVLTALANTAGGASGFLLYDAELAALGGLTSAADKIPYFTGSGTAGLVTIGTGLSFSGGTLSATSATQYWYSNSLAAASISNAFNVKIAGNFEVTGDLTIYQLTLTNLPGTGDFLGLSNNIVVKTNPPSGSGAPTDADYLVGTANGSLSAEIVVGTSPGGELGGTWASPTIDDSVTVTGWVLGTSTATTPSAGDNDTSLATSAFVTTAVANGTNNSAQTWDAEWDTIAEIETVVGRKFATNNGTMTASTLIIGDGARGITTTTTASGALTFLGTPSSANFASLLTDESGSGVIPLFSLTSLTAGDGVKWSGSGWTNGPIAGAGTVTSVALTAPSGFTVSGSPITSSGTLAISTPSPVLTNGINIAGLVVSNTFVFATSGVPSVTISNGQVTATTFAGALSGNATTASTATTATTALTGDSATAFFSSGTLEDARLSANVAILNGGSWQWFQNSRFYSGAQFDNGLYITNYMAVGAASISSTNVLAVTAAGGTLNVGTNGTTYGVFSGSGAALTALAAANITSGGTLPPLNGASVTNLNYDSPTNTWTINTAFPLGQTNLAVSIGTTTGGITGIANGPSSGNRWGELIVFATGTVTFTNPAAVRFSDGLTTRTITNGTTAVISFKTWSGFKTNAAIVHFP